MKVLAAALLLIATPVFGQSPVKIATAERVQSAIHIDGILDEAAWSNVEPATDFTESYPDPGAPASQRTEARILYDDAALYVGIRMYDPHPDSIAAQLARRDASGIYSDWVHLIIDSYHDHRTAFRFSVNPLNVKKDVYTFDDGNEDASWDAIWEVDTRIDSLGWTAEYRIPLSQIRFSGDEPEGGRVWGLQIMRDIARRDERVAWSPWTPQDPGFVSRFGDLVGLTGITPPTRLEITPYISAQVDRSPVNASNPFHEATDATGSIGVDLQYGLPAGLTLTATVNPDFGQVEVDPSVVNLSAFETFFPEKRPFFVEGSDVFRFGQTRSFNNYAFEEYFYSRRIGRTPQRRLGGSEILYTDAPDHTTILGAAKVSGKTGGWTIGLMDAVTAEEQAEYIVASGDELAAPVEPLTNYFVGRVRRDFRGGNTVLGGMVTATNRKMGGSAFDGLLRSQAYLGGVDFEHSWADRAWTLSGYAAGSLVEGDADVIAATQLSSARYYQRPDADYLDFDPSRTSLTGHMAELAIQHAGAWDGSLAYKEVSPGFEINDLGFQSRTDYRAVTTFLGRRISEPGELFRSYSYSAYSYHVWNRGGDRILDGYAGGINGTLNNLWYGGINLTYRPEYYSDRFTRGGPLAGVPSEWQANLHGGTDSRKAVAGGGDLSIARNDAGAFSRSLGVFLDLRPSSSVRISLSPNLSLDESKGQYVRAVTDPLADATFGTRYVFADLQQTTLALDTRLDWTFTPTLSLQLYAQPFIAAGDYSAFKEFRQPGEFLFDVYGDDRGTVVRDEGENGSGSYTVDPDAGGPAPQFSFGDPDFNIRSLRGNAVLRWEYRPGSTIFLVWQQQRSGFEPLGEFDFGRDARAIFRQPAQNIFLIKATYWIG
ncbi:MAG TPA: DUF5916 domain-containing protein [Longimicrobiaceae bacterium]|nr:DUF5916 domain-containing protein [Longimicrobiaceae bacterium]